MSRRPLDDRIPGGPHQAYIESNPKAYGIVVGFVKPLADEGLHSVGPVTAIVARFATYIKIGDVNIPASGVGSRFN